MLRSLAILASLVLPLAASQAALAQAEGSQVQRVRNVTLGPGEKCPPSSSTEIVVCGSLEQPYRIPKQFRDNGPIGAANQSWVNRTATVDDVSRVAGGLPDTCSTVGTGGQTGCALATARAWAAERRAQKAEATRTP